MGGIHIKDRLRKFSDRTAMTRFIGARHETLRSYGRELLYRGLSAAFMCLLEILGQPPRPARPWRFHRTPGLRRRPAPGGYRPALPRHRRDRCSLGRHRPGGQAGGGPAPCGAAPAQADLRQPRLRALHLPCRRGPHRRQGAVDPAETVTAVAGSYTVCGQQLPPA